MQIGLPKASVANKMLNDGVISTVEEGQKLLDMDPDAPVPAQFLPEGPPEPQPQSGAGGGMYFVHIYIHIYKCINVCVFLNVFTFI